MSYILVPRGVPKRAEPCHSIWNALFIGEVEQSSAWRDESSDAFGCIDHAKHRKHMRIYLILLSCFGGSQQTPAEATLANGWIALVTSRRLTLLWQALLAMVVISRE